MVGRGREAAESVGRGFGDDSNGSVEVADSVGRLSAFWRASRLPSLGVIQSESTQRKRILS